MRRDGDTLDSIRRFITLDDRLFTQYFQHFRLLSDPEVLFSPCFDTTDLSLLPHNHLLGTCRMGDDPKTSVVDRYHRAHDVPNLFLVDGSRESRGG
jgi:choline dehydrogenase-like flavoprotein